MQSSLRENVLKHFVSSQKGAIAVIAGLALLPLTIMVGIAIDLTCYVYLKNKLTMAADAAALGSARYGRTQTIAENFFYANYPRPLFGCIPQLAISYESSRFHQLGVAATVTAGYKPFFAGIFNISLLGINIKTYAEFTPLGLNGEPVPFANASYYTDLPNLSNGLRISQTVADNIRVPMLELPDVQPIQVRFISTYGSFANSVGFYIIAPGTDVLSQVQIINPNITNADLYSIGKKVYNLRSMGHTQRLGFFLIANGYNYNQFKFTAVKNPRVGPTKEEFDDIYYPLDQMTGYSSGGVNYVNLPLTFFIENAYTAAWADNAKLFFTNTRYEGYDWDSFLSQTYKRKYYNFADSYGSYNKTIWSTAPWLTFLSEMQYYNPRFLVPVLSDLNVFNSFTGDSNLSIFHSVASKSLGTLKLNASQQQQAIAYGNSSGWMRIGFEDRNIARYSSSQLTNFRGLVMDVYMGKKFNMQNFSKGYAFMQAR